MLATIALAVVSASGVAFALTPSPGSSTNTAATSGTKAADAALNRALKDLVAMRGGPSGVIAVVQRGDHREVHTFGVANLKTDRRMRIDDHMRIASTSKAFSGAAALSLVSKGALSLNDTIGERLPKLPNKWSEVTLRQLLNHTSGLPDYSESPSLQTALQESPTEAPPSEELLLFIKKKDLRFDPGTQYKYSNSDNIAVALMIEDATGRTYEGQLQEQVYGPLGLRQTTMPRGTYLETPYIRGYDNDQPPEDYSKLFAGGWFWASGGMVSTPADLNTFIRGYVGGDLFDLRTRERQRQVFEGGSSEPPGPGQNSAGLGIFRYETRCGTVWGHTGNIPGYTQFMAASPGGRRSATVSINSQITPTEGAPGVFKALRHADARAVCAALSR